MLVSIMFAALEGSGNTIPSLDLERYFAATKDNSTILNFRISLRKRFCITREPLAFHCVRMHNFGGVTHSSWTTSLFDEYGSISPICFLLLWGRFLTGEYVHNIDSNNIVYGTLSCPQMGS